MRGDLEIARSGDAVRDQIDEQPNPQQNEAGTDAARQLSEDPSEEARSSPRTARRRFYQEHGLMLEGGERSCQAEPSFRRKTQHPGGAGVASGCRLPAPQPSTTPRMRARFIAHTVSR